MAEQATPLLQARGLTAGYGGSFVLRNVDLTVHGGDWVGLLGANGSGKSTLLRALTGQIPLQAGEVAICGIDLRRAPERAKRGFGYAVDPTELPTGLSGRQYLAMVASIRGCAPNAWPHADLPGLLALQPWLDHPIGACSLGTRAKLAIAAALLDAPPLLILDEALNGLDPLVSIRLRRFLAALVKTSQHAVILSTHMLEQVEAVATDVLLLDEGAVTQVWARDAILPLRAAPGGMEAAFLAAFGHDQ